MPAELLSERRGATLVLTISDPATRNTLSTQVIAAGIEALGASEAKAEVRAVVLRGAGAHFCAGGNLQGLSERRAAGRPVQHQMIEHLHHFVTAIRAHPKPVIAAAAGAGFSLALACDLIVAASDARFMVSHGKLGLSPDGGATWLLARSLPRALAQQLIWLAEPIGAEALRGHGVVTTVAPSGQALEAALQLADRLAAMAPNALASAKELIEQAGDGSFFAQLAAERDHFLDNLFQANGAEGIQAF